ncbi:MAG: hypothetical protein IJ106_13130, partial [Parasporobacterium sp.]|nr:hypothetical protein [Parasporobacterium sp.]
TPQFGLYIKKLPITIPVFRVSAGIVIGNYCADHPKTFGLRIFLYVNTYSNPGFAVEDAFAGVF